MFNLKNKIKNVGFWLSLTSAIVLFLQTIGLQVDSVLINQIVSSFCGILVVLGIVSNPKEGSGFLDKDKINKNNI